MRSRFPLLAGALLLLVLSTGLSACGSSDGEQETSVQSASPAAIKRANAICRQFRREVVALGHSAVSQSAPPTPELITERLVRPSIPLLKRVSARMQALQQTADSHAFTLYSNLFDPFIILTEKRLQAGLEEDQARAHGLEDQLTDLSVVQRRAARLAGIHACDVDFPRLLIDSVGG